MSEPSLLSLLVGHWRLDGALTIQGAVVAGLYLWGVQRTGRHWPLRRTGSFLAGVAVVIVALESGLDTFDDRLLSVHMIQHLLLLILAPLLLVGGRPALLALRALPTPERRTLARALSHTRRFTGPVWCLALFTTAVVVTHLPSFYDATLRHPALHDAEHLAYLISGSLMWWPLLDGDPAPRRRLSGLGKLVYLLAAMAPMAVIGAYLDRHPTLAYQAYGPPAHALGISAVIDQQQAGAIMWVLGSTIMVAVGLWVAVAAMVAEERRLRARETRGGPDSLSGPGPTGGWSRNAPYLPVSRPASRGGKP
jgi:cytochrome c oxidase assembly factor CtaG